MKRGTATPNGVQSLFLYSSTKNPDKKAPVGFPIYWAKALIFL